MTRVYAGYLGWSNVRAGLEFYVSGEGNARWLPRRGKHGAEMPGERGTGALLQDDLESEGSTEGCGVIVIALPGYANEEKLEKIRLSVEQALYLDEQ